MRSCCRDYNTGDGGTLRRVVDAGAERMRPARETIVKRYRSAKVAPAPPEPPEPPA